MQRSRSGTPLGQVALRDSPASCPGSGWQLMAAAGRDGATGPRGERGERGSIGPRGEPAPVITGWRVDRVAYAAVPLLSDGSEGAPLARTTCPYAQWSRVTAYVALAMNPPIQVSSSNSLISLAMGTPCTRPTARPYSPRA
jgi:hypothetical protein